MAENEYLSKFLLQFSDETEPREVVADGFREEGRFIIFHKVDSTGMYETTFLAQIDLIRYITPLGLINADKS